jgi:hypothetical protein
VTVEPDAELKSELDDERKRMEHLEERIMSTKLFRTEDYRALIKNLARLNSLGINSGMPQGMTTEHLEIDAKIIDAMSPVFREEPERFMSKEYNPEKRSLSERAKVKLTDIDDFLRRVSFFAFRFALLFCACADAFKFLTLRATYRIMANRKEQGLPMPTTQAEMLELLRKQRIFPRPQHGKRDEPKENKNKKVRI